MAKQGALEAQKTNNTAATKQKANRDISEMLDSIRQDWSDLSKKPIAVRHTKGIKKLLRWCEEELKAVRKYYNETDA